MNGDVCWNHSVKEFNECGICLDETLKCSKYNTTLTCNHIFCTECINTWIVEKNKNVGCPLCREKINIHILSSGFRWGEKMNLLYRIDATFYPLSQLSPLEKEGIQIFFNTFHLATLNNFQFKRIEDQLKKDDVKYLIFQKLKNMSFNRKMLAKKYEGIENITFVHIFI